MSGAAAGAAGATVGRVARIARYPVKSFQGELLERATFSARGLDGDRALGVVDVATGYVLSAKQVPELLHAAARTRPDGIEARLPGSGWLPAPSPALDAAASAWLDREVRAEPPPVDGSRNYTMSFNVDDESVDSFDWHCPPGTFVDLADVHLLTTASLRSAAAVHPDGAWSVDRFRPTVLVEVAGDGYPEDGWVGGRLAVGAQVELVVDQPTIRCAMTTRAQNELPRDLEVFKSLVRTHEGNLGLYATLAAGGEVRRGDEVRLAAVGPAMTEPSA